MARRRRRGARNPAAACYARGVSDQPEDPALQRALDELFAAPFPDFVAERKRLVGELRKAGHRAAATAIGKVNRPSLSCWTINQLVRRDLHELDALFSAAHRVRLGDFAATADHRALLARLQHQALELLRETGQPTSDATMRRIATTLSALSAYGGFAPDTPGRMIEDRDPPGFDAMDLFTAAGAAPPQHLSVVHAQPAAAAPPLAPPTEPPASELNPDEPSAPDEPRARPRFTLVPMPPAAASPAPAPARAPASASAPTSKLLSASVPASTSASAPASAPASKSGPVSESASPSASVSAPASASVSAPVSAPASESLSISASAPSPDPLAEAEAEAAHAAAQLAAAQAAALAAAARVQLARQRTQLETLRAKHKRLASAIHDHEQAILQLQRDLTQRQTQLDAARSELAPLEAELDALTEAVERSTVPPR